MVARSNEPLGRTRRSMGLNLRRRAGGGRPSRCLLAAPCLLAVGAPRPRLTPVGHAGPVPPPYDVYNFLNLLGIEISSPDSGEGPIARLTVTHDLIAGTGYLWAPVVITLADALCAIGVSRNWPANATSFTTVESKANFTSSAREGEMVTGTATPLHLGGTTQVWDALISNDTTGRKMA